jgi:hypothetical protein
MMAAAIEARDLVQRCDGLTARDHISFAVQQGVRFLSPGAGAPARPKTRIGPSRPGGDAENVTGE